MHYRHLHELPTLMSPQEEDFVSHTYDRDLLNDVEDDIILGFMNDTMELISGDQELDTALRDALTVRLNFRSVFLSTVSQLDDRTTITSINSWSKLKDAIQPLKNGHKLLKLVPQSFSTKLQRKLASTVPPRPVVTIAFETAYKHLQCLCIDGEILLEVLEYHDSQSLIVSNVLDHQPTFDFQVEDLARLL